MQLSRNIGARTRGAASLTLALLATLGMALAQGAHAQEKAKPSASAEGRSATQRLVFAHYYYDFQGDPRKSVPAQNIRTKDGLTLLTDHPWESVGPWMSYDRAQWHKNQFQMMAAAGVDVVLAVYRGDKAHRHSYAVKGLDVLAQGLKEFRAEALLPLSKSRQYPQVALALDLGGLADQYGGPVSLKDADVQKSLYGMVRDFYTHVPEEFRATVQLPAERIAATHVAAGPGNSPSGAAYIVRLMNDGVVMDADNTVLDYVNKRFAQEFGARLLWIGTPSLRERMTGLDAVSPYPAATAPGVANSEGWIRTASLGPGYDASSQGPGGTIRPRDNGQQTLQDFRRLRESNPNWILLDSWNDYAHGTDIAPTLEHGLLYRDLLRGLILDFKMSGDYAADFIKATAPRVVQPGRIYQVEVAVQNSGSADWDVFNTASLSYRWVKDGKYVGDEGSNASTTGQVRGDTRTFLIGVAAPIKESKPLPPGEYQLEFGMTRRSGNETVWFEHGDAAPYRIPVTVGAAPAIRPYWINSTMTTLARHGSTYPAQVRLRNDGSEIWKKGSASIAYRWRKVSSYLKGVSQEQDAVIAESGRVTIPADVVPGREITVDVPVSTTDKSGQPLPTWSPQDDWSYVLEWDLDAGTGFASASGGTTLREPIAVVDRDPAPVFLGCSLTGQLVAGNTEKITVGLRNNGPESWQAGRDKVIVHWYYMDGTEASWNDDALPLPEDVPPFSKREIEVPDDPGPLLGDAPEPAKDERKEKRDKKNDKKTNGIGEKAEAARIILAADSPKADAKKPDTKKDEQKKDEGKKKGKKKTHMEAVVRDTILRDVPVRVPYYFGPMYCVMDFQHDGLFSSTSAASKGGDILVIPVNIFSPTFTPLPISAYFNVDGISQDVDRGDGNIDGRGNSLPAEFLPPYVPRPSVGGEATGTTLIYPSGLWVRPLNNLDNTRVCFLYPNKDNGTPNMIQCQGQRVLFGGLQRTAVHVLALSTEEDAEGEFTLFYGDGSTETRKVTFTHWNDAPKHGEKAAFITPHRHTAAGDDPSTRCYLDHYVLPTDKLKQLVGVELPKQPAAKVLAITLESATLKGN